MSNSPLVTIVTPAYNPNREYLLAAIGSVMAQSFTNWELIVVDDGSAKPLDYVTEVCPAARLIRQANRGVSAARNSAILASRAEYIAFLDADDLWEPAKLALQVDQLQAHPEIGLSHTGFRNIGADGVEISRVSQDRAIDYHSLLASNDIITSTVVVRREALSVSGLFNTRLSCAEDYEMWLSIARHYAIGVVAGCHASYRIHKAYGLANEVSSHRQILAVKMEHARFSADRGDERAMATVQGGLPSQRRSRGCVAFDLARQCFRRREWSDMRRAYWLAFRLYPAYVLPATLAFLIGRRSVENR